jgi:hypothetical protein
MNQTMYHSKWKKNEQQELHKGKWLRFEGLLLLQLHFCSMSNFAKLQVLIVIAKGNIYKQKMYKQTF